MIDHESGSKGKGNREDHAPFLMLNCLFLTCASGAQEVGEAGHGADGCQSKSVQSPGAEPQAGEPSAHETATASARDGSACGRFEEEVTCYLDALFRAFKEPACVAHLRPYLFEYDIEALSRLGHSEDARLRYMICRTPNDVLIVSVGVFDSEGLRALPCGPELKHGPQGQMGRGEAYYHFAFACAKTVPAVDEAIHPLEENLAIGLKKFVTILSYVTGTTFDLAGRLQDGEVYHLVRSVENTRKRIRLEQKQDEFLDAYLEWRQCRTEEARKRVMLRAHELRKLDPGFTYIP